MLLVLLKSSGRIEIPQSVRDFRKMPSCTMAVGFKWKTGVEFRALGFWIPVARPNYPPMCLIISPVAGGVVASRERRSTDSGSMTSKL
jgi:hypothetical protein